jgi:maltokinase
LTPSTTKTSARRYTKEFTTNNKSQIVFSRGKGMDNTDTPEQISSRVLGVDSSNSALIFGEKYFFKLYRKLFEQTNPEVEMVSFLTQHAGFSHIPTFAGSFAWQRAGQPDITLGMAQRMIQADKDNWVLTGDFLNDFLYGVPNGLFAVKEEVFEQVALLGQRTGQMHLGLYAPNAEAAFAPEPFTDTYRQFLLARLSGLLERRYALLMEKYLELDAPTQRLAWIFMEAKELIDEFAQELLTRPLDSLRIRIHGDYHLGQVLTDNGDFILLDFEGEPEASIADRKIKHSPLKDVAGMIRSYHYAVSAKLFNSAETQHQDPEKLLTVTDRWYKLMRDTYLEAYMETFGWPHPLFKSQNEFNFLLLYYLLEKAVYELGYEISYRPSWVKIPLRGIVEVIREIEKLKEPSVRISRLGL